MIKANITGLNSLVRKSKRMRTSLQTGKQKFIQHHIKRDINIQGQLIKNIWREVYSSYKPTSYERTENLLKSVRVRETENGIEIYMDGNFLEQASTVPRSWETGFAVEAKAVNYAWLVEEGHTYQNVAGHKSGKGVDFTMPPRRFMGKTFSYLIRNIEMEKILSPLFRMWSL